MNPLPHPYAEFPLQVSVELGGPLEAIVRSGSLGAGGLGAGAPDNCQIVLYFHRVLIGKQYVHCLRLFSSVGTSIPYEWDAVSPLSNPVIFTLREKSSRPQDSEPQVIKSSR